MKRCCEKVAEALAALRTIQAEEINSVNETRKAAKVKRLQEQTVRTTPNTPVIKFRGIDEKHAKTANNTPSVSTRNLATAKSEVKDLITFMNKEVTKAESHRNVRSEIGFGDDAGISEAARRFQFRDEIHGPQITSKGQTLDAVEKREAATKAKRQKAYTDQCQNFDLDSADVAMNSALRNMMAKFKAMIQCDRCGLFFLDNDTDELYFHVEEEGANIRFSKTKGIAGLVACSGEAVLIKDAYKDPRFNKAVDKMTGYRTRNILCEPIRDGLGDVIAVMQVRVCDLRSDLSKDLFLTPSIKPPLISDG